MSTAKVIGVSVTPGFAPPAFVGAGSGVSLNAGVHSALGAVGHGLVVAAPVLAGVAAAAGAVMMTRAGMLALADLDTRLEVQTQRWRDVQAEARRWQGAYARLVRCNAQLVQLDATVRRWGPDVGPVPPMPAPLDPFGGSDPTSVTVDAVERWCDATERMLPGVAEAVRREELAAAIRPLGTDSSASRQAERTFAERMDRLIAPPSPTATAATTRPAPIHPATQPEQYCAGRDAAVNDLRVGVWDVVRRRLEELRDGPALPGWEDLVACAEQVRTVTDRSGLLRARNEFHAVAQQFQLARDARAGQARIAATCLSVLDPAGLPPAAASVIARLRAVAAQTEPLEDQLLRDATALITRQEQAAEARYTMAALQLALAEQGLDAQLDLDRVRPRISVTRDGQVAGRLDWSVDGDVRATFEGVDVESLPSWVNDIYTATRSADKAGVSALIRHAEDTPAGVVPTAAADVCDTHPVEQEPVEEEDEFDDRPILRHLDHPR